VTDLFYVPTPRVFLHVDRVRRNIARMAERASSAGVRLRPHTKTHKSPEIARWQLDAGASGICCAKLGEAEVFADHGIDDIRLPYPVQPSNAGRAIALLDRLASLSIIVDDVGVAGGWSEAMTKAGRRLDVLVKIDVGFHRCGMDPDRETLLADIQRVASMPGLRFRGLLSYAGQSAAAASIDALAAIATHEIDILTKIAGELRKAGVAVDEISVGGTAMSRFIGLQPGVTEMRPGNYIFYDRMQTGLGSAALDDCALAVVSTVVGRPAPDRVVFDAGSKTLTSDAARGFASMPGHGLVFPRLGDPTPDPSIVIERLNEEHAIARVPPACRLAPGDRVTILPNHSCVVTNMVDELLLIEDLKIVGCLPVRARGKIW
jgi:D-serine deaminase-like pyridoxal phosphate-dependent protein